MKKTMIILAVIGTETTYEHLAMRTGMSPMLLGGFVYHLMRRGFITKTRACRTKPAQFSITDRGRAHLAGHRTPRNREPLVVQAIASRPELQTVWPSQQAAERLGYETFDYCERN